MNEDEIEDIRVLGLYKLLSTNFTDESIDKYERDLAQKLVLLRELRLEMSRESVVEEMSKNMAEDKDKITLLSMVVDSHTKL